MDIKIFFEWTLTLAVVLWPLWAILYALSYEIYKRVKPVLVNAPLKLKVHLRKLRPRFARLDWGVDFRRLHPR